MKEIDFKDRVPNYPGRITLSPVVGQPNIFDMSRADEPIVEGTPINKALLQSITQSRLTGRFYPLDFTASYEDKTYNISPFQILDWKMGTSNLIATAGPYQISANKGSNAIANVFSAGNTMPFYVNNGTNIIIKLHAPVILKKVTFTLSLPSEGNPVVVMEGSNDESEWVNLLQITASNFSTANYTTKSFELNNFNAYQYYKLSIIYDYSSYNTGFYQLSFDKWVIEAAKIAYESTDFPRIWEAGQRVLVKIPDIPLYAIVENTVAGIKCNRVLNPARRYELVYNGTAFDAKEV